MASATGARGVSFGVVGALVAVGSVLALSSGTDSRLADFGLALVSGGVVGGSLVLIENLLTGAADRRGAEAALRLQLTSTTALNGIDLSDRELSGIYLPGRDLVAAHLCATKLAGSKLYYADLRYADLTRADLSGADLAGCTLRGAILRGANLRAAVLDDADLRDACFDGADLRGASMRTVRAAKASFRNAELTGCRVADAVMDGADLAVKDIGGVELGPLRWDGATRWPAGFVPPLSQDVPEHDLSALGLPDYLARRRRAEQASQVRPAMDDSGPARRDAD